MCLYLPFLRSAWLTEVTFLDYGLRLYTMLKVLHLDLKEEAHKMLTFVNALIGLQTRETLIGSISASIFSLALPLL